MKLEAGLEIAQAPEQINAAEFRNERHSASSKPLRYRGETGCIQPLCDEAVSVQDGFTRLLSVAGKRDTHLLGGGG